MSNTPAMLRHAVLSSACVVALMGCGQPSMAPAAKVDGKIVSQQAVATAVPQNDQHQRDVQLQAFIAEQLLANAAVDAKLDQQADVAAQLEIARRNILARAYVNKVSAGLPALTDGEIRDYYDKHPALFSKRRIYRLQEIAMSAPRERIAAIQEAFRSLHTFNDRAEWLKKEAVPFTVGVAVKPAEELPADLIVTMLEMNDGSSFDLPTANGLTTVQITGIEEKPLSLAQARPYIERFVSNERVGNVREREVERLRKESTIDYFKPYDERAGRAAAPLTTR